MVWHVKKRKKKEKEKEKGDEEDENKWRKELRREMMKKVKDWQSAIMKDRRSSISRLYCYSKYHKMWWPRKTNKTRNGNGSGLGGVSLSLNLPRHLPPETQTRLLKGLMGQGRRIRIGEKQQEVWAKLFFFMTKDSIFCCST